MNSGTLYFEKISKWDRPGEPVTVSIPFAPGRLADPARLAVRDGGPDAAALPVQAAPLTRWPDGSIQWLLAHFQADLPGNADKLLYFDLDGGRAAPPCPTPVRLAETDDGIRVDTGAACFSIPRGGFLPLADVVLDGREILGNRPFAGFAARVGGRELSTASCPVELEVEEAGPLRAVVAVRGTHRDARGGAALELAGRVTAYAGKSYVEVEHGFCHVGEEEEVVLESLELAVRPAGGENVRFALGEGHYRTAIRRGCGAGGEALERTLDAETVLYQSWEHFPDCFYGDFWADWTDDRGGVAVTIHQAHQNFPKGLSADARGLTCRLYPAGQAPARILRGMGKTHRMQLYFHASAEPIERITARSLQFQLPDRPSLARRWFAENNPWVEGFFPQVVPDRLLTRLATLHDGRPKALGMMHFGDAPDAGYTGQGRGRGRAVWVNNEYDRPHACSLFYALTGLRRALDSALVTARHWLDVDLCRCSADPLRDGGLVAHSAYHATGAVYPSHEWVEGLLDYYAWTGRREGLDCAVRVAENILRHMAQPPLSDPGEASVREGGWALRAMVGMYLGTGRKRWADEARKLAGLLLQWHERFGALLAPYTSHAMPRVPFMIALTVNSLARFLLIADDERVRKLIVATADDLLAHCLGPDGIFYYKELPSLRRPYATPHVLEALTHAYRITGNQAYLRVAARQFAAMMDGPSGATAGGRKVIDPDGAVVQGAGDARPFAAAYTSVLLFAAAATPLGLLDGYDYPPAAATDDG